MNYTIYHCHSDISTCVTSVDSVTKFDQYIDRAKECGMKALAISEHGSVMGWVKKKEHIEVHIWEEYLMFAELLGVADRVREQFSKLYPKYKDSFP